MCIRACGNIAQGGFELGPQVGSGVGRSVARALPHDGEEALRHIVDGRRERGELAVGGDSLYDRTYKAKR